MAQVNKGILDGYIGRVGTVVGYFMRGKAFVRSYSKSYSDANTQSQQLIRARFSHLTQMQSGFIHAIRVGFVPLSRKKKNSAPNNFVALNFGAVTASDPDNVVVDYSKLLISKGNLSSVSFSNASFNDSLTVSAGFSGNLDMTDASRNDKVYAYVYNPTTNDGVLSEPVSRSASMVTLSVPSSWTGETVHVYGFVVAAEPDERKSVSTSAYLGSGIIA